MIEELEKYQNYLDRRIPSTGAELEERARVSAVIISRTGHIYSLSRRIYNEAKKNDIFRILVDAGEDYGAPKSAINELIKTSCKEEQYIVDWSENINKTAYKQLELIRSLLANERNERTLASHGN